MSSKRDAGFRGVAASFAPLALFVSALATCRSLCAQPVLGRDEASLPAIYVPKAKIDTLEDMKTSAPDPNVDVVVARTGDRLTGKVVGIASGVLRLTGRHFEGEVRVLIWALDRVSLAGTSKTRPDHTLHLTNGDRILGRVAAISSESIEIRTGSAGLIEIARNFARRLDLARGGRVLVESNFEVGAVRPWNVASGKWSAEGGELMGNRGSQESTLFAEILQDGAVTVVAEVRAVNGNRFCVDLVPFADAATHGCYANNSVCSIFEHNAYHVYYARDGKTQLVKYNHIPEASGWVALRFAYDPETGKANLWRNADLLGQFDMPNKPQRGQYVLFNCRNHPCKVRSVRVLRGVVPPFKESQLPEADPASHTILLANEDKLSTRSVSVKEGSLTGETPYGKLHLPLENVRTIVFATRGQRMPRRLRNEVRVQTASGARLTLALQKLTDKHLVGTSDHLGQLTMRRESIITIRFGK